MNSGQSHDCRNVSVHLMQLKNTCASEWRNILVCFVCMRCVIDVYSLNWYLVLFDYYIYYAIYF